MDGIQRLFLGVYYKNVTQVIAPFGTSGCPGNGGLDNVRDGLALQALALTLIILFNLQP
jgi:hypothetical protein